MPPQVILKINTVLQLPKTAAHKLIKIEYLDTYEILCLENIANISLE